ncbi:MAG: YceI family protein [Deltaproteobacteria bacterium]|nr:YceI family protein [Deltaproteobacteria bacterium]
MLMRVVPVAFAFVLALPASASTWVLDAEHSTVGFSIRHMMVSDAKGAFDKVTGTVELDDKDATKSKVNVEIDVASVNTRNAKRDDHLRGADFFDAAKFPKITFKSTKIEKAGAGFKVTGDFTMHGVTKPVVLDVGPLSDSYKDPWGGTHRGTSATAKIARKDFGLTYNSAIEKGGVVLGEDVVIDLQIELTPPPAPPPPAAPVPAKK